MTCLGGARDLRRRGPADPGEHLALLVDDAGGDLGAADVDPDGQSHGVARPRSSVARHPMSIRSTPGRAARAPLPLVRGERGPHARRASTRRPRPGARRPRAGSRAAARSAGRPGRAGTPAPRSRRARSSPRPRREARFGPLLHRLEQPAGLLGRGADVGLSAPGGHRPIHSAGSGSNRIRSTPSRSAAPTTVQRRSALGQREHAPRRSRRSAPARRRRARAPSSSRSANGSASVRTNSSPERSTASVLSRRRARRTGRPSPYSCLGQRAERVAHRPARRRSTARAAPAAGRTSARSPPAARPAPRTQPVAPRVGAAAGREHPVGHHRVDAVAEQRQARSACGAPRRRPPPPGSAPAARVVPGSVSTSRTSASSACRRASASKTPSRGIGSPATLPSTGRSERATCRSGGNTRSTNQPSASGRASSRSVSAVGAQSTTTTSQRPDRTWSRSSSRASTSSAPGQHGQLLGGHRVDAGAVEHRRAGSRGPRPTPARSGAGCRPAGRRGRRRDLDRLRSGRRRRARRRASARRRWTAPAS